MVVFLIQSDYVPDFVNCIFHFMGEPIYRCIPRAMPIMYMTIVLQNLYFSWYQSLFRVLFFAVAKPSSIGLHCHKTFYFVGLNCRRLLSIVLTLIAAVLNFILAVFLHH